MSNQTPGLTLDAFDEELAQNISLSAYLPLGVGGIARYYFVAKSIGELGSAVAFAHKNKIPYLVIGNGQNIIFSDEKFDGLVIKNESSNILFSPDSSEVIVDSGVELSRLINLSAGRDLGGVEFLMSRPDTVGGALYGNVGQNQSSIGGFTKSVTLLLNKGGELVVESYPAHWMNFGNNFSKLKNLGVSCFGPVILTVRLQLTRRRKDEILRSVREYSSKAKLSADNSKVLMNIFKDPSDTESAADCLARARVYGLRSGGARASRDYPNSVVNLRGASAGDVRFLIEAMKQQVMKRTGIELEERIEYVGEW